MSRLLLITHLKQIIDRITHNISAPTTIWVAYSGGVDSHVLLYALKQLNLQQENFKLRAIHIHHGLSANADQWAKHCEETCAILAVPCHIIHVNAKAKPGESPEAAARAARYQAFLQKIPAHDWLVTAHHQDDQAETLLLQLLRGAGVAGLAAMPNYSQLQDVWLVRPLLEISRAEIIQYAQAQQLHWIEDETNQHTHFDRNYVRKNILPTLQNRWPSAARTLARSAKHCASAAELIAELASGDIVPCISSAGIQQLSIKALLQLSAARRDNVLRYWLQQRHLDTPSTAQLQQLLQQILLAAPDAMPSLLIGNTLLRRYRDSLYAAPQQISAPIVTQAWDLTNDLVMSTGKLTVQWLLGQGIRKLTAAELAQLQVRAVRVGERMHPQGRVGSHPLKKLFQEWGVAPWLRAQVPLICCADEILVVPGYAIAAAYAVKITELGWNVQWLNFSS